MKRLLAFVLVLSLCLFALSVTSPLVFGGAADGPAVELRNGDANGDGVRELSDAIYLLQWLYRGGEEPVAIVCPADQGDRVAELEAQLAVAGGQLASAEAQLAAANAEIAVQAGQIVELEGQDNSDCPDGFLSQFIVEDCQTEAARSVATEGAPFDDDRCQMFADDLGPDLWKLAATARMVAELGFPPEFVVIELSDFFRRGGPEAAEWFSYCELECPE